IRKTICIVQVFPKTNAHKQAVPVSFRSNKCEVIVFTQSMQHSCVHIRGYLSAPRSYLSFVAVKNLSNTPIPVVRVADAHRYVGANIVLLLGVPLMIHEQFPTRAL